MADLANALAIRSGRAVHRGWSRSALRRLAHICGCLASDRHADIVDPDRALVVNVIDARNGLDDVVPSRIR